ncbi:hypothetical protein CBR_g36405 [Chara braunii]|uniref:Carrier domain-containing protein n=1 Tax=Chara braunii TaxID=69332 RepID=A0A388LKP2_CHABU|nr:hypothetical protein CBR_g36405 [Chara braunii]|eukprot:GBG82879.1 hypothetical protein CBR_g36405 [Chara braunii]
MAGAAQAVAAGFLCENVGASVLYVSAASSKGQKLCRTSYAASCASSSSQQRWWSSFSSPATAAAYVSNVRHNRGLVVRPLGSGLRQLASSCFDAVLTPSSLGTDRDWRREAASRSSALSRTRCARMAGGDARMSTNHWALSLSSGCHERIIGAAAVALRAAASADMVGTDAAAADVEVDPSVMAMVQSTIAEKISEDVSKIVEDMALSDLGIDSLDQVEIMMAFEEKCGVSVEDGGSEGGAGSLRTVKDVAVFLQKLIAKKNNEPQGTSSD